MFDVLIPPLLGGYLEILDYLSAHVLTCLIPAFFIAGGIAAVVSTGAVLRYFGPTTPKPLSYGVASVSGTILAVCSCTILPLFAGIFRKGAGIGPAVTFLFAGPAINLLAIVLTARQLGLDIGVGRAVAAIVFAIVIGLIMAILFRREEAVKAAREQAAAQDFAAGMSEDGKPPFQLVAFFGLLVAILLFGTMQIAVGLKIAGLLLLIGVLALVVTRWFERDEIRNWMVETWTLAKLIVPILLVGIFMAGVLKVVIPEHWIANSVGGNGLLANLIASVVGALMYFSTLTEVPIVKMLVDLGMGKGPALALLLAGPALSLPNMLVIRNIMGTKKTAVYILLVVTMATVSGYIFGNFVG